MKRIIFSIVFILTVVPLAITQEMPPEAAGQFDFLAGRWKAEYHVAGEDGPRLTLIAYWNIEPILDGRALRDDWKNYDLEGNYLGSGTMIRHYDEQKGHWVFAELTAWHPELNIMWGEKQGETMVMYENVTLRDGTEALARRVFSRIQPDSFHWRYDISRDNGKSWQENQAYMKVTRVE